ncbi:hypothetical protein BGX26_002669 [Mortierella sp. AD094]|nr:hypothetical protein BGX26_002669 [Mortierella sp. AD094]
MISTHDYLTAPPSPPKPLPAIIANTDSHSTRAASTSNTQAIDDSENQDEDTAVCPVGRAQTLKVYQKFDDAALETFVKDVLSQVISGDETNQWKELIYQHKGDNLAMKILQNRAKKNIEGLVLQETYLNTVAPTHGDVQNIPMAQYRDGTSGVEGLSQKEIEKLKARAIQAGASASEVRYSKQCTSCMIQGFDCSGHKPICSQCYYSSSRTTHSLSRNASPTGDPIPSSCSYPVEGKPLVPGFIFRTLRNQAEEESKVDEDQRLPLTKVQKAIQNMTVSKDESKDVGWKINFKGKPLMDKNPATGVDYLIKSSSARSTLGGSKKFRGVKIRDVALKMENQEPSKKEGEEGDGVDKKVVESVGPLAVRKTKKGPRKHNKATWIERTLLQEDEQTKGESVNVEQETVGPRQRNIPVRLTGKESMIRLESEDKPKDQDRKEETFLSFSRNSREALIEENNRWAFARPGRLLDGTRNKVNAAESISSIWAVGNRGEVGATTDSADIAAAIATKTGEATAAEPQVEDQRPTAKDDVVELDIGGMKIKRKVKIGKVKRDVNGKKVKVQAYRKHMAKTFRPWIAHKSEKVIPSACDIPETSFLQAIHFYASYYYTHAYPCPDIFEAMDLTSHIALGMIIQEIISDFAFKLGKESQLEDIEVKQEKLDFAKNLAEWNNIMESGGKIPKRDEVKETLKEMREQKWIEESYKKKFQAEYERDKALSVVPQRTTMEQWIKQRIEKQRKEESEYIGRLRKHNNATGIPGASGDDGDADTDEVDDPEIQKRQSKNIDIDNDYWEELRYLRQYRFKPDTMFSKRFLVNDHDSDGEQDRDSGVENGRGEQLESSEDEADTDTDRDERTLLETSQQGSQLQARPSFAFESDDEEYVSENESLVHSSDDDDDDFAPKTTSASYNMDPSDNSSGDEGDKGDDEIEPQAGQEANNKDREINIAEERGIDNSDGVEEEEDDSDEHMEEPTQTIAPRSHATTSASTRVDYDKMNEIVSDSEKGSNSEEENEDDGYSMPSSVLTTLSDTRLGRMFGRSHNDGDDDDDDDDDEVTNNGVISQVVMDDSSSEDEGNVVGPSESEEEEEE